MPDSPKLCSSCGQPLADGRKLSLCPACLTRGWQQAKSEAVAFAHEHGVLHRDLKLGYVLFDDDDRTFLSDFGQVWDLAVLDQEMKALGLPWRGPHLQATPAIAPLTILVVQ